MEWELVESGQNGAICGVSEITVALRDENVVARHKQQWDDREHNNGNGLKIEIK